MQGTVKKCQGETPHEEKQQKIQRICLLNKIENSIFATFPVNLSVILAVGSTMPL